MDRKQTFVLGDARDAAGKINDLLQLGWRIIPGSLQLTSQPGDVPGGVLVVLAVALEK